MSSKPSHLLNHNVPGLPEQMPLDVLGLSSRSHKALERYGLTTVQQLAQMSDNDILAIRGLGAGLLAEIREKLRLFVPALPVTGPESQSPFQTDLDSAPLPNQTPLEALGLSIRPYNALRRHGVKTVERLAGMSDEEVLKVRNIGANSLAEIRAKLASFTPVPLPEKPQPTNPKPVKDDTSLPSPLIGIDHLLVFQKKGLALDKLLIERLALPKLLLGILHRRGIHTLQDLARQPKGTLPHEKMLLDRFRLYLNWIVKQDQQTRLAEVSGQELSPFYRSALKGTSLDTLATKWLSALTDRQRNIIYWRYGLNRERLTLDEVGQRLELTRERVRQIEGKALRILKGPEAQDSICALRELLIHCLKQTGGLMDGVELQDTLEQQLAIGDLDPIGVVQLIFQTDECLRWISKANIGGLVCYPLGKVPGIQKQLAQLMKREWAPLAAEELLARFRKTQLYLGLSDRLDDAFVTACLRIHPDIEMNDGICALTKWSRQLLPQIIQALRKLGKPAHYTEITEIINTKLPGDVPITPRAVHIRLMQHPDIFVWVGLRGTYGLKEWGLKRVLSYEESLIQVFQEAGHPLRFEQVLARIVQVRPYYDETSLVLALGTNERFRTFSDGSHGLAEWREAELATEDYRLKRLFDNVEEPVTSRSKPGVAAALDSVTGFVAQAREKASDGD